jgi:hypothetical protein
MLFAIVERVAVTTDFSVELLQGRACLPGGSAGSASHGSGVMLWVNSSFHKVLYLCKKIDPHKYNDPCFFSQGMVESES